MSKDEFFNPTTILEPDSPLNNESSDESSGFGSETSSPFEDTLPNPLFTHQEGGIDFGLFSDSTISNHSNFVPFGDY